MPCSTSFYGIPITLSQTLTCSYSLLSSSSSVSYSRVNPHSIPIRPNLREEYCLSLPTLIHYSMLALSLLLLSFIWFWKYLLLRWSDTYAVTDQLLFGYCYDSVATIWHDGRKWLAGRQTRAPTSLRPHASCLLNLQRYPSTPTYLSTGTIYPYPLLPTHLPILGVAYPLHL